MRQILVSWLLSMAIGLLAPSWSWAHAIGVDCTLRQDKVEVEAFYDDDTPAIKAKVQVVAGDGEVVVIGITDDEGKWSFALPKPGKYEVRVDAGAGHRAKRTLEVPTRNETTPPTQTDAPTREEFTRTPWVQVLIGLTIIGGGSAAFLWFTSWRRTRLRD